MIRIFSAIVVVCVMSLFAATASAQTSYLNNNSLGRYFGYTNLNRTGASNASNYYNLVRPQIDTQSALRTQQGQLNSLQRSSSASYQALGKLIESTGRMGTAQSQRIRANATGTGATFNNRSHYYAK
ncbi:MAG: hypothetical protein PHE53_09025 [Thermoguttaceae bacterium]|nr:hypothetical protein [Thermoguttaceae bacterium]